jgi:hypothetical protein
MPRCQNGPPSPCGLCHWTPAQTARQANDAPTKGMLAGGGRCVLTRQIFQPSGHCIGGDFVWLLSELTVASRPRLKILVAEERSKKRAAMRTAPIWSPGANASRICCDLDFIAAF